MTPGTDPVAERLAAVRARAAAAARSAGRDPDAVTLVAVSKTVAPDAIAAAIAAGQLDFGENRAQELVAHAAAVDDARLHWHFVGALQTNKVKAVAPLVARWHSVDREALLPLLARYAPATPVLVQVNLGREPHKAGCPPEAAAALVDRCRAHELAVDGLATVPPEAEDPRPFFTALRDMAARLALAELSMGMSGDFEVAIAEGATLVRVGAAIFGPRPRPEGLRR